MFRCICWTMMCCVSSISGNWWKCSPLQPHASPLQLHSPKQLKALYVRKITAGTQKWRFGKLFGFSKGWVFWFYVSFLGSILWIGLNIIELPEMYQLCANRIEYAKSQPSHLMWATKPQPLRSSHLHPARASGQSDLLVCTALVEIVWYLMR